MSLRVFVVAASAMISLTGCSSVRMLEIIPLASAPPAHEEAAPGWGKTTVSYKEQPPAMIGPPVADGPYTLDTGDRLRIFVYGQPNLSRLYTVDHSG